MQRARDPVLSFPFALGLACTTRADDADVDAPLAWTADAGDGATTRSDGGRAGRVVVKDAADHVHEPGAHVLLLVDTGGNDTYRAPNLSLGSGHANGMSFLVNVGGDDVYEVPSDLSLGAASLSKEWFDACPSCAKVPTVGVFLDVGRADRYVGPLKPARTDGSTWSVRKSPPAWGAVERSAGVDVATGVVELP